MAIHDYMSMLINNIQLYKCVKNRNIALIRIDAVSTAPDNTLFKKEMFIITNNNTIMLRCCQEVCVKIL